MVEVTGIPFWLGKESNPAAAAGPGVLRERGLFRDFTDRGDLALTGTLSEQLRAVSSHVSGTSPEHRQLFIGGDHGLALGTLNGILDRNPDTLVIWLDAHADLNTPTTSTTGNFHGMPLSFLLPFRKETEGFAWVTARLDPRNLLLLGPRDIDPPEEAFIRDFGIENRPATEGQLTDWLRLHDPRGERPIHLSFDVDVLDPVKFPSTGTPVKNGASPDDILGIMRFLASTGRLRSADIVEFAPKGHALDAISLPFLAELFRILRA